jgi:CHAT domain-containing protein
MLTARFSLRLALAALLAIIFYNHAYSQGKLQEMEYNNDACYPALNSARATAAYFQRGQVARAESQHRNTMALLRQLRSLDIIQCSFAVQWEFPLEGKKYPAYITEYSTLAFDEAFRTGNIENATELLAQKAGLLYSKNLFPETMRAFRQFGVFYDPFAAMDVYESEDEIVRKAQIFKDVTRRYARFMYRTNVVRPPLCEQNDCRHLGWDMQEKIKSRLFRAQILRGALLRLNATARNRVRDLLRQDKELRLKRNQFYFSSGSFIGPTPFDGELQTVGKQIAALIPEYDDLASEIARPEDISKVLAPDETLLSFFYVDKNDRPVYAWKLERDSAPQLEELTINIEDLYKKIRDLKIAIEGGASIESIKAPLAFLQNKLLSKFNLRPNRKLVIAVDQNLSSLPFDIMPWGAQGMMLDVFDIRYVPSATVFYYLRRRSLTVTPAEPPYKLDYAGFSYPSKGKEELNYANIEIEKAGSGFGSSPPNVIRQDAAEADLYKNSGAIANARYLHLVTHSNPLKGIAGGVYLPFGKEGDEDGELTDYEIVSRLKNHAELVVLSACQTATSNENLPPSAYVQLDPGINGEGSLYSVSGCLCNYGESFSNLSGSFFAAGSKQLLLTQWLIRDDESTAEFIKRIFDMLRAGKKPNEALRLAKQQMRDDKKERIPPVNWAGFILAGD